MAARRRGRPDMNETTEQEFQQRIGRIEPLIQRMEKYADPSVRADAKELVKALLDLHAVGLARMLTLLTETGEAGRSQLGVYAADSLVGSLLLLHGLHPVVLETRVRQALEKLRV